MIAAGLGCRAGCSVDDLIGAVHEALAQTDRKLAEIEALYAPDWKHTEPALPLAAAKLGKRLTLVSSAELAAQAALALTVSAQVQARFGVPSASETAALAGALALGVVRPRLLGIRAVFGAATCALASAAPPP